MWAGMSKGDILRGLVSERLAIATREILGAVDMLVAGYEEEASGFRREIERQKRELEVLLHEQQGLCSFLKKLDLIVAFYYIYIFSTMGMR